MPRDRGSGIHTGLVPCQGDEVWAEAGGENKTGEREGVGWPWFAAEIHPLGRARALWWRRFLEGPVPSPLPAAPGCQLPGIEVSEARRGRAAPTGVLVNPVSVEVIPRGLRRGGSRSHSHSFT